MWRVGKGADAAWATGTGGRLVTFGWTPRQLNTAVRVAGVGLAVALVATVVLVVRNAPEEEPLILEDPYCWSAQPAEPDFAAPPFDFDPVARAAGLRDGAQGE